MSTIIPESYVFEVHRPALVVVPALLDNLVAQLDDDGRTLRVDVTSPRASQLLAIEDAAHMLRTGHPRYGRRPRHLRTVRPS